MKNFILAMLLFVTNLAMAQQPVTPRIGTIEYNKIQVPCYILDMPYASSTVEDAINDRFKKMGVNGKSKKGFNEYRNVLIPEISSSPVDVIMKIDRPSRKEKDASVVYMIVTPVGVPAETTTENNFAAGSNSFLSSLALNAQDYSLELEIKNQEDEIRKAEKKSNNLVDDANDMQKKLKKLQDDIADNIKQQQAQVLEVKKQKDILTTMYGRRRKI